MQDFTYVTGMVIKSLPVGENDRHVSILTKERGKISAYCRGARRPKSPLLGATSPFCFGRFKLFTGRDGFSLAEAEISNYFEEISLDIEKACYGSYFLEVMDYYTRENADEVMMLGLIYQTLKALDNKSLPNKLVRYVFEMKAMVINGEFPGIPSDRNYSDTLKYTVNFIVKSPLKSLYTFVLSDEVFAEVTDIMDRYRKTYIDRKFKSLEVLGDMGI